MESRVLLIHPNKDLRESFCSAFETCGFRIIESDDPKTLGRYLDKHKIDIIMAPLTDDHGQLNSIFTRERAETFSEYVLVGFTEDDNTEEQRLAFESTVFDTLPLISEPDIIRLRGEIYAEYLRHFGAQKCLFKKDPITTYPTRWSCTDELKNYITKHKSLPGFFSITILHIEFAFLPGSGLTYKYAIDILKKVGSHLVGAVRANDKVYHIFPTEYLLLHPDLNELVVEKAARRIKKSILKEAKDWPSDSIRFVLATGSSTYSPTEDPGQAELIEVAYENLNWERKFKSVSKERVRKQTPRETRAILVIDDDPVTRAYLEKLLDKEGYEVILTESGDLGWKLLEEKRPQVVLLDWMMPGLDGMEFCRRIRNTQELCSVYIIVLSMITGTESVVYALETGADDYLSKPLHDKRQELLARIEVGFRIQRMQEKALQTERLQGVLEMAATVAHEINQPLMAMSGLVDLLMMDLQKDEPGFSTAERLKKQITRLGKLTRKLNHITRYETLEYPDGIKLFDIERATSKDKDSY